MNALLIVFLPTRACEYVCMYVYCICVCVYINIQSAMG